MEKSGRGDILKLVFWTDIFVIIAEILGITDIGIIFRRKYSIICLGNVILEFHR